MNCNHLSLYMPVRLWSIKIILFLFPHLLHSGYFHCSLYSQSKYVLEKKVVKAHQFWCLTAKFSNNIVFWTWFQNLPLRSLVVIPYFNFDKVKLKFQGRPIPRLSAKPLALKSRLMWISLSGISVLLDTWCNSMDFL